MLRLVLHFFALALVTSSVRGEIRISLNSGQFPGSWDVRNDSSSERIPANVPGGIYSDLNLVEDLFYRQNDHEFRWVGYENWTYETTFELASEILNMTAVNLVFHGIDTVGDVYLNGVKIRSVDNMFIKHIIPIKTIAKEGNNTLEVRLKSPVLAAKEAADGYLYDVPPDCPALEQQGECHINFLRKMQASFSWDWGLAAPSAGIWKPVEIEAYNTALVRDIVGTVTKNGSYYIIDASCHLESESDDSEWGSYSLSIGWEAPDSYRKVFTRENLLKTQVKSSVYVYQATFEAFEDQISVWWPNGYGDQPIYQLYCIFETINLDDDDNEKSSISTNIGFRSVELVQEEVQEGNFPNLGLSFYFKVNDVPIFAKGANWIPGHILPELSYNEKMIRQLLQSAKDANMNMLRVWGGGVYESDLFYQVADELGIMIWQDMMFAVALYPSTQNYLESVTEEVTQQVRRLATHPSVAVWAGNNENEAAITGNWFNIQNNTDQYISDYILLYVLVIKSIVESEDASRSYVISSPSNGLKTEQDGYISSDPYSPLYGDVHYYNYDNDPRNTSLYPNTRFASEYGFQGMPSFKSISKVSEPEDWNLNSEFTIFRQHHPQGYEQMTKLMKYFLPLPEDDGSEEFYKTFIYYSQISQAIATKTESEKYRRDRSTLTDTNEGLTMGALYWQLNDVWHAPTWASIEFGGRWKMLHYYAVKFFAPVIVVPDLSPNGELRIFGVSDLLTDVEYGLTGVLYSWDSYAPKAAILGRGILANSSSSILNSFNLSDFLAESDCEVTTCFLQITLSGDGFQSENFFYPSSFSDVTNLRPANISATVTRDENTNEIVVNLETDGIAPFVWLETDEEGIFSDNGFTLVSTTAQVTFSNRGEEVDIDKFKETLEVRSLLK